MPEPLIIQADAASLPLADASVHCCVTSPPYWGLRDYGLPPTIWGGDEACEHEWGEVVRVGGGKRWQHTGGGVSGHGQARTATCARCGAWRGCLGLEPAPEQFIAHLVQVFREVRRVLRDDGTLWVNIGDSYAASGKSGGGKQGEQWSEAGADHVGPRGGKWRPAPAGLKSKDLVGIPWMLAFALRADGWYLRQDNIWAKPNPMPESVTDRCTKAHEYVFLFSKSPRYFYDADAIREPVTSTGGASFGKQDHDATGTGAQSRRLGSPDERNHPLGRNKRSVWTISTQACPEAHFATYPTKLPLTCIKAGTSEKGVCPACGAPWKRVVERAFANSDRPQQRRAEELAAEKGLTPEHIEAIRSAGVTDAGKATVTQSGTGKNTDRVTLLAAEAKVALGGYYREFLLKRPVTTHWLPSCDCYRDLMPRARSARKRRQQDMAASWWPRAKRRPGEADWPLTPAVVLDNFNGAATTAIACLQSGRSYIGIERKAEYIEISHRRLERSRAKMAEAARPRKAKPVKPAPINEFSLFEPAGFNGPSYTTEASNG